MKIIFTYSFCLLLCWSLANIHFMGNASTLQLPAEIEAVNDHFNIPSLEPTSIDVLANDKGENLKLKEIIQSPCCGRLQEIGENGIVTYAPKTAGNDCTQDSFIYLIEDEAGNVAMAEVFLQIPSPALIVEVDRDCTNAETNGTYTLNILISAGIPPFTIWGSINDTINELGFISVMIEDGVQYEVMVIDAVGNEFFEMGGDISCLIFCPIVEIEEVSDIGHCTCDGKLVPDFHGFLEYGEMLNSIDGHWFGGINEVEFSLGDTIPPNTFFNIDDIWTNYNCYYFKSKCHDGVGGLVSSICTLENYELEAHYDAVSIEPTDAVSVHVLENDKGTRLQINQILSPPSCGELLEVNQEAGIITYVPHLGMNCTEDSFVYQVIDTCGNLGEATVYIDIEVEEFIVQIQRDCHESHNTGQYRVAILIEGGVPPFSVSGTFNQVFDETGLYSFYLEDGNPYEIWVADALGNQYYEFGGQYPCNGGCVAYYLTEQDIASVLQCQCSGNLVMNLENLGGIETITSINGYWYTNEIEHTTIALGDTLPPNAIFWIDDFSTDEYCYYFYSNSLNGLVSDICTSENYALKANSDYVSIPSTDTVHIPVLENDAGTHLQFSQILSPPNCGKLLEVNQETGIITYTSHSNMNCSEDSLTYEVIDACDNLKGTTVYIDIKVEEENEEEENEEEENTEEENKELLVEVTRDCTNVETLGTYTLSIAVVSGVPPFTISGSINTTLEEVGVISATLSSYELYEVSIVDGAGNEFYQNDSENPCPNTCFDLPIEAIEDIANCLYNGDLVIDFNHLIENEANATLNGYWFDNGLTYTEFHQGDTIPSNKFIILDAIYTDDSCYNIYPSEFSGYVSDFCPTPIIQARPNFVPAKTNEATIFNVLENDIGEGIFIEQITEMPPCGTLEVIDTTLGTVRYTPNEEYFSEIVSFAYQIQDHEGNTSETTVRIVKDDGTSEMIVGMAKDCSNAENTGTYIASIVVAKGTPPFVVTGLIDSTLNEFGMVSKELEDGIIYEIHLIDSEGNEFSGTGGEIGCTKLDMSIYIEHLNDLGDCTCDGGFMFFEDESLGNINGFWYKDGDKHFIEQGVIIPHDTYLEIFEIGLACQYSPIIYQGQEGFTAWVANYCSGENYNLQTEPDFVSSERGDTAQIHVLQNDKGTNLSLKQVDYSLQCGNILNIDYENGITTYRSNPTTHCEQDQIAYYVSDACGNTKKEVAVIGLNHKQNLIVEVERDCTNENETGIYQLIVTIIEGQAPFNISGSIHEILEETGSISTEIEDGIPYEIEVMDAAGNRFFEISDIASCGAYCQEYQSIHIPNLEAIAACTCEGELFFHFEGIELEEEFEAWGNYSIVNTYYSFEIEPNQIVPNNYYIDFSLLHTNNGCYNLWINNELGFNGDVSDFCPNKVPPTPSINKYASETLLCGEGEIVLIAEGGGEEAVYHWYEEYNPDFLGNVVPADPPTGAIWRNSDILGKQYIYLVSTDTSGCVSEPLEVFYQHYAALEIQELEVKIDEPCNHYQISFDIIGGSGLYEIEGELVPNKFTSEWIPIEENYSFTIDDSHLLWLCESAHINGTIALPDTTDCNFTSISNIEHPIPNIQLFPNPNDGNFTLSLQLKQMENIEIEVVDILGKAKIRRHSQSSATFEQQLNLNLPSGLYFLQVSGENWRWIEKVIVR